MVRVLLSEASSLTAREFLTVLGADGIEVEAVSAESQPIARFSRFCAALHRAPAASADPVGYLRVVDALMATGRFEALIPTHEQAWLFSAGRHLLPHAAVAVADPEAFARVESKLELARTLDAIGLPQPAWRPVQREADLDALGFPVWVKAAYSTAGRGVVRAAGHAEALAAWRALAVPAAGGVMIQAPVAGAYAQVEGVFDHGRLLAAAASELLAGGAGGSAAARLSVAHPRAVAALERLGAHLRWHGGLLLDYFHTEGVPRFIECNPRIAEPGNAFLAGVDFSRLLVALASGNEPLPEEPLIARAGIRTRSTLAIMLGAAERRGSRRAVVAALVGALRRRPPLQASQEVLTPVRRDPPSLMPLAIVATTLLVRPASVSRLAGDTVRSYSVTPDAATRAAATR